MIIDTILNILLLLFGFIALIDHINNSDHDMWLANNGQMHQPWALFIPLCSVIAIKYLFMYMKWLKNKYILVLLFVLKLSLAVGYIYTNIKWKEQLPNEKYWGIVVACLLVLSLINDGYNYSIVDSPV